MQFTKMQGAGNDYIYVNGFQETVRDAPGLARKIADRHFGIGGDGLILIQPPESGTGQYTVAQCRMEMYNADGSRAQMCGNGLRCIAKYAHDHGIARGPEIIIETDAGAKKVHVSVGPDGKVNEVEVDMGTPMLERAALPLVDGSDPATSAIDVPIEVRGRTFRMTAVSMANPHAIVNLSDVPDTVPLSEWPIAEWGPAFENHAWFPERVNTEFITMRSPSEMDFRVWERGSGETLACGTGACAAVVAGVINGWCESSVVVHLLGGDLRIRWECAHQGVRGHLEGGTVFMTGPAVEVFQGEWPE